MKVEYLGHLELLKLKKTGFLTSSIIILETSDISDTTAKVWGSPFNTYERTGNPRK
ncbi:MAG: hypothetical protein J6Q22_11465 [Prevotella sp.]|nr:hypothetical protein [Prevotella sp.]